MLASLLFLSTAAASSGGGHPLELFGGVVHGSADPQMLSAQSKALPLNPQHSVRLPPRGSFSEGVDTLHRSVACLKGKETPGTAEMKNDDGEAQNLQTADESITIHSAIAGGISATFSGCKLRVISLRSQHATFTSVSDTKRVLSLVGLRGSGGESAQGDVIQLTCAAGAATASMDGGDIGGGANFAFTNGERSIEARLRVRFSSA